MANRRVDKTIYLLVFIEYVKGNFCAGVLLINILYGKDQNITFLASLQIYNESFCVGQ